ncbi:MAG: hypothetical protein V3T83_18285 [Acidobacteriota bacterium]
MVVYFVFIAIQVWALLFVAAMVLGVRTKPTEADDPEAELWMVSHYKLVRFIPAYEAASAKLLPELIRQARKDSRRILALPVRRMAYLYLGLFWLVVAPLSVFCWARPLCRLAGSMELLWSSAMTGLLVQMGRCRSGS